MENLTRRLFLGRSAAVGAISLTGAAVASEAISATVEENPQLLRLCDEFDSAYLVYQKTAVATRSLMTVDLLPQMEAHERAMNKLMRTFTSQMEALRKHRNGGNQKVVVEHVHVHNGGQAIVGNVSHGGRSMKETETQSHGKENLSLSVGHLELPQSWRLPARFDG
jgi:hypothetical protein